MPHERTVVVSDVGWTALDGQYMVTWSEDGAQKVAFFREDESALSMVRFLEANPRADPEDIRAVEAGLAHRERVELSQELRAERSLEELEFEMARQEEEAAYESLQSLEPHVHRRPVAVRRHRRRKP